MVVTSPSWMGGSRMNHFDQYRNPSAAMMLGMLNVEHLKAMMQWLSPPKPWPTRKADLVEAVEGALHGESLRRIWDGLDDLEKLAVSEALHGDWGYDRARFAAKYGAQPKGHLPVDKFASMPFRMIFHSRIHWDTSDLFIPRDLADRLRSFVEEPPETSLASHDDVPRTVRLLPRYRFTRDGNEAPGTDVDVLRRNMERAAQRDLVTLLRLIDLGRVGASGKTRRATAAAMRHIDEGLAEGDFYETPAEKPEAREQVIGPIRAHAWPWLVQAGRLAEVRGSKLALTKAGHKALGAAPAETLRLLWRRWVGTPLLDEFSRIDDIKGQNGGKGKRAKTAVAKRRPLIAEALTECPVGRWVLFDDFSNYMQAEAFDFEITRDPWTLYVAEPYHGSLGYDGYHDWSILEGRYVLCVLFEYAATLGLIDVAYTHPANARRDFMDLWGAEDLAWLSRYDGLLYFRLNPLGAYCLGLCDTYEPGVPDARASLNVFPDRRVTVRDSLMPEERLVLETIAEPEAEGVWRLDYARILKALENGQEVNEFRDFLAARDDQPLPEAVEGFFGNVERGARALTVRGSALLIECADEETAARVAGDRTSAKFCMRAGKTSLVVRTAQETAFRKAVRGLGYGMPPV